jgi:hypothetical protein
MLKYIMKKIKFETSIGIFEGIVDENNIVKIENEEDYWKLKELYKFDEIIIYNDNWLKIKLIDDYFGDPEYKYEIIE